MLSARKSDHPSPAFTYPPYLSLVVESDSVTYSFPLTTSDLQSTTFNTAVDDFLSTRRADFIIFRSFIARNSLIRFLNGSTLPQSLGGC